MNTIIKSTFSLTLTLFSISCLANVNELIITNHAIAPLFINDQKIDAFAKQPIISSNTPEDKQYQYTIHNQQPYSEVIHASFTHNSDGQLEGELIFPNHDTYRIGEQMGLFSFKTTLDKHNVQLYVRTFLPDNSNKQVIHLVIDQQEPYQNFTPNENTLDLLTYNTKLAPFFFEIETPLNQPGIRANDIANYLETFDVIVMEELFDYFHRQTMISRLSDSYPYHTKVGGNKPLIPLSGGVMIFSRWPITKEAQIAFDACGGVDCLAAKGVVYAKINKNGQPFHIFGTHLQAGHADLRQPQLNEFEQFIESQAIPLHEPILMAGDFNLADNNPEKVQLLQSVLKTQIIPMLDFPYSSDGQTNTMSSGSRSRIDYVLPRLTHKTPKQSTNQVRVYRDFHNEALWNDFDLSDHYAVASHFEY